ncbi:keratin, type I cytoskeletal 19-like [Anomaloglossus baeobatrachus]|uniref:keratin, type I cytoskeletal 19-like n=1 Tax=Anomaloglossus baeobatrachus TaxID=238106 RepID=UPI003F503D95
MSHSYSSAGSHQGKCQVGSHSPRISTHVYGVNHGKSHNIHHGGSHTSHHIGSNVSHHGYSHKVHYGGGSHLSHCGSSHKVHNGNQCRAPSVHGGSGGKGISISKHSSHEGIHSGHHGHGKSHSYGLLSVNEKETMQHLNNRLASYIDKVRSLEQQNAQLEGKIHDWYERNQPSALPDFSSYFRTIQELQSQISSTSMENAHLILQIDNARLAADDFRNKFEMERQLSSSAEADVNGLRILLEELNREICSLQSQVQNLQEELQQMKRNHDEEVNSLRTQLGARINVEVDAAPSVDLNRTLSEIRQQYENLMERNLREVEAMFQQRTEELNQEVASGSEQLQSVQTEVIDLKRKIQTLEIELQSQLSMKSALEGTLAETEATFGSQLSQLQSLINKVESQLSQLRSDLERQNQEYKTLMDQKNHLEMEIATYKRLLEGHDIQ